MATIAQARRLGKAILYHAHSTEEDFKNSFLFSNQVAPLFKKHLISMYTQADEIVTPTPYAKRLLESYGIEIPISSISNGIDLEKYLYDEDKAYAFRRYFGLNKDQKVVIGVGLYIKRKGIQDFLDVASHFPDITFIWFGYSSSYTIPSDLKTKIENHSPNVILPGYVKGSIIEGAYMDSDLFFFPSYEETEGIVVLEALAAKCPVLIRDIGVYEDWLEDNKTCYKAHDNFEFAQKIKAFYNHELNNTVDEAYELAKERTLEKVGQELKKLYSKILEGKQ